MNEEMKEVYKVFEREIISLETYDKIFDFISKNRAFFDDFAKIICDYLKKDEYKVVYHSHVDGNEKCTGAEALFRLNSPDMFFNPFVVFSLASYYDFEEALTLKVFDRVCKDVKLLKKEVADDFLVSYNVNPKLVNKEFCKKQRTGGPLAWNREGKTTRKGQTRRNIRASRQGLART